MNNRQAQQSKGPKAVVKQCFLFFVFSFLSSFSLAEGEAGESQLNQRRVSFGINKRTFYISGEAVGQIF